MSETFGTKTDPEIFDVWLDIDIVPDNVPSAMKAGSVMKDQNNIVYDIVLLDQRTRVDEKTHIEVIKKL